MRERNVGLADAIEIAGEILGSAPQEPVQRAASAPPPRDTGEAARRIWEASRDAGDTVVEDYLQSRGLELPPRSKRVIRFRPSSPLGAGKKLPCRTSLF